MGAFVVTWRELLIVVIAVLAIYVAELVLLLRWSAKDRAVASAIGANRRARGGPEERSVEELTQEVGELRKQVTRLQADLDRLRNARRRAVPEVAGAATEVLPSPYNQAIHLARQGASASDVASGCGISRGEAELIVALYRKLRI
jgi:hypothetical protein